jgi:MFS family permease
MVANCLSIVSLCVVGTYSDVVGRKTMLFLPLLGGMFEAITAAIVIQTEVHVAFLLIAHAFQGVSGGGYSFLLACYAYAADITERDSGRSMGLAIVDAFVGLGYGVTQATNGYVIELTGYFYPMLITIGLILIAMLFLDCLVPETRSVRKFSAAKTPMTQLLKNIFGFYFSSEYKTTRTMFILAILAFMCIDPPGYTIYGLITLYGLGSPFCWSPTALGWYNTVRLVCETTVAAGVLRLLQICLTDVPIAVLGCLSGIAFYVLTAFSTTSWMLYVGK